MGRGGVTNEVNMQNSFYVSTKSFSVLTALRTLLNLYRFPALFVFIDELAAILSDGSTSHVLAKCTLYPKQLSIRFVRFCIKVPNNNSLQLM